MIGTVSAYHLAVLEELLAHIDRLEQLHVAGETPLPGQLWDLFRKRDAVRKSGAVPPTSARVVAPSTAIQTEKAARRLVELVLASLAGGDDR